MSLPVKLNDVIQALDEAGEEHTYYLDKRTGEIVMITNEEMEAAEEDENIFPLSWRLTSEHLWDRTPLLVKLPTFPVPKEFPKCLKY